MNLLTKSLRLAPDTLTHTDSSFKNVAVTRHAASLGSVARIRGLMLFVLLASAGVTKAETIGTRMAAFLNSRIGTQVGGGECAHAASEALRVAGGEFVVADLGPDSPMPGDYVWGTLIKTISVTGGKRTDSHPTTNVQVGDIVQYRNTMFVNGTSTMQAAHHTSIISKVSSSGHSPTEVLEQNVGSARIVQRHSINVTKMTAGWIRIYRPKARVNRTGERKFTIVNHSSVTQTVTMKVGSSTIRTFTVGPANTAGSFSTWFMTASGTAVPALSFNGQSVTIIQAAGYEISSGRTLRKLSP